MKCFAWLLVLVPLLAACGGPSEADVQSTVVAAVAATSAAGTVATNVAATTVAAAACEKPALEAYAKDMTDRLQRFSQQRDLVGASPRMSMGAPLQRLLDLQTETKDMDVPSCLESFHSRVVQNMALYQTAYQNFAAQGAESVTAQALADATQEDVEIIKALIDIQAGSVPPTPAPTPAAPTPTKSGKSS